MGRYFGNTPQVGVGNAFLDAFNRSLAQAKQDRLVNRSIRMQDEDRASAKVMQGLQVQEQYPGTTILPTSYTGVGPGTLPNPVDQVQIGKVEPGQPLNVQSGPGLDFSVPGAVTDVGEKQRILTDRLQRSLTAAFAGAQATEAGKVAGNPLSVDLTRSEIGKNNAQATKDLRPPVVNFRDIIGQDGTPAFYNPAAPQLPPGFKAATPAGSQPHFSFPVGADPTGKPVIFRANTKTGDVTPTGVDAKNAPQQKQADVKEKSYVALMEQSLPTMQTLIRAGKVRPWAISAAIAHPTLGNTNLTQDEQTYMAAAKNFLAGTLHQESGARLSNEQWQIGLQRFFPTMGDSQQTMEQKLATAGQVTADRRNLVGGASGAAPSPAVTPPNPYR